jgi:hypothetical protein
MHTNVRTVTVVTLGDNLIAAARSIQEVPINLRAIGTLGNRTVRAAGNGDGTVRAWDPSRRRERVVEVDIGFGVRAVAFGAESMIAAGGPGRPLIMQVRRLIDDSAESANTE